MKYWYVEGGSIWSAGYTQLLIAAHAAIKRADPGATVVTAGLASFPWKYLAKIYKAGGKSAFEAVGINFFTGNPKNVIRGVRVTSKVLRAHRQGRKKVWLTEVTWPAAQGQAPGATRAPWQLHWQTKPAGMAARLTELYQRAVKVPQAGRHRARVLVHVGHEVQRGRPLRLRRAGALDRVRLPAQPALKAYAKSARGAQGCARPAPASAPGRSARVGARALRHLDAGHGLHQLPEERAGQDQEHAAEDHCRQVHGLEQRQRHRAGW